MEVVRADDNFSRVWMARNKRSRRWKKKKMRPKKMRRRPPSTRQRIFLPDAMWRGFKGVFIAQTKCRKFQEFFAVLVNDFAPKINSIYSNESSPDYNNYVRRDGNTNTSSPPPHKYIFVLRKSISHKLIERKIYTWFRMAIYRARIRYI